MKNIVASHNYLETMKEVLLQEADELLKMREKINGDLALIAERILHCQGRVVVTGVGKSGIIGRKISATLASTGTPSIFLHPTEGLHGDLGMVTEGDLVLALSKSGESEEVLNILPSVKRIGAKIIAFTGNAKSSLAVKADWHFCIGDVKEACPLGLAPTTSTTLMLALGDALAIAVLKARNFSAEHFAVFHPGGSLGKRLLLTVKLVLEMTGKNPVLPETASVRDAIFLMTETGMGAANVVNHEGKLAGIMTDGDIRRYLTKGKENILDEPVRHLVTREPFLVYEDALASDALQIMQEKHVNVLPVINHEREPVGMIHIQDMAKLGV